MPRMKYCYVYGCPGKRGWQEPTPLSFFSVPAIISETSKKFSGYGQEERKKRVIELSKKRREGWLKAIKRESTRENKNVRICARHFITGRPADLEDENNPDWIPLLNLGTRTKKTGKTKSAVEKYERDKLNKKRAEAVKLYGGSSDTPVFFETEEYEEVLVPKTDESSTEDDRFVDLESSSKTNENGEIPDEVVLANDTKSTNDTSNENNGHWHVHFCTKKACLFSKVASHETLFDRETQDEDL